MVQVSHPCSPLELISHHHQEPLDKSLPVAQETGVEVIQFGKRHPLRRVIILVYMLQMPSTA